MAFAKRLERIEKAIGLQKPLPVWRECGETMEEICQRVNVPPGRELLVIGWEVGESD
jgi:hypothetical protein